MLKKNTENRKSYLAKSPEKYKLLLLGKIPPPYYGPAMATKLLVNSRLKTLYDLLHFNTGIHKNIADLGKVRLKAVQKNIRLYLRYILVLFNEKPDFVLVPISQSTFGIMKDMVYVIIGKIFFSKVAIILRGSDICNWQNRSSLLSVAVYRAVIRKVDAAFVLSERLVYLFKNVLPVNKIHVVTNGLNHECRQKGGVHKPVKLVCITNLKESKGIFDVVMAMRELKHMGVGCCMQIYGTWNDEKCRAQCEDMVNNDNLSVLFGGPIHDEVKKWNILWDSDIFVFTPRAPEGQPWVVIEALAAGLPVISTDRGAIADMVLHGTNGYIVSPDDPVGIANHLSYLINNPEYIYEMGRRSRILYEEKYTEDAVVNSFSKAIDSIANSV